MNQKVSIYLPNLNGVKYIKECLDSVEVLTYPELEVLINDDGSTDGSLEICEDYAKQNDRVRIYKRASASGSCGNINETLSHATGEFICKLDSDDIIATNFWETVLPFFRNEKIGFVRVGLIIIKGEDRIIIPPFPWGRKMDIFSVNKVFGCSPFRLSMFKDVGGWDTGRCHPDWDFWLRCVLEDWKWAECRTPLYYYRKHKDSLLTNLKIDVQEEALDYYRNKYRKTLENYGMRVAKPYSGMIGEY